MINWVYVFINAFWIVGLAILVATVSFHYWQAAQEKRPFAAQLNQAFHQRTVWIGFVLITIGLAGSSNLLWESIVWGVMALLALFNLIQPD